MKWSSFLSYFQPGKRQRNKILDENDIPLTMIDTIHQGKRAIEVSLPPSAPVTWGFLVLQQFALKIV